jgi:hypothetical protein
MCFHTVRKSRICCDLCKSWYLYVKSHVRDFLMVCKHIQDKTVKYHNLHKSQHVLDFLMVCKHLKDNTVKYHDLYKSQHVLDFLVFTYNQEIQYMLWFIQVMVCIWCYLVGVCILSENPDIKVDIWHPAVALRYRNPPRQLIRLKAWAIPLT